MLPPALFYFLRFFQTLLCRDYFDVVEISLGWGDLDSTCISFSYLGGRSPFLSREVLGIQYGLEVLPFCFLESLARAMPFLPGKIRERKGLSADP